ncbi:hypothetical protein [Mycolicibacterium hodleri]|uniref:Uncharacterized protein n=1 Tax=Mycolicibacterium hodleri TaxID=49897 RepID=A0A502E619_9MYCO|nr:hypothetical protein [Mycolicibacterium hodleri]TPG32006.1 hypothetical protein EAH80_21910 [Mycolicibacterium hodleri]
MTGCSPSDGDTVQRSTPAASRLTTVPFAPSTTSKTPADTDYLGMLISASDLTDADDTFTEQSSESQPNGSPGASAFFVNGEDNRAIVDTFVIYADAATATATLKEAVATLPTLVKGGTPTALAVGTDGVMISGTYPNQDKAVTLVFFTEGTALVRLEFQSATGDATTDQFVTSVAKMQQIALRVGLARPR